MIRISTTQLWVHDQDEALAFWTEKAGFEVREDVTVPEMGNFRWLAVAPPGQDDIAVVLMAIPGAPMIDQATSQEIATLTAKGFAGTLFLTTDDVMKVYEDMSGRGSSSPRSRPSSPTASTAASATRPATASGWRSARRWAEVRDATRNPGAPARTSARRGAARSRPAGGCARCRPRSRRASPRG